MKKFFLICFLFMPCFPALASDIEEIVVTADLTAKKEKHITSSVFIVSKETITSRGAQHFEDIVNTIPNLNFASGSNRARFFQIRGVGERSQFASPINSSVAFLLDQIDFSGAATIASTLDIDQIEVLRGPQGTRYGASALGGLIKVKTKDPNTASNLEIKITQGNYANQSYSFILNSPITEQLLFRGAFQKHRSDGYMSNRFLDREDTNGRNETTSRIKLRWLLEDYWTMDFSIGKIDIRNGYDAFSLDNTRTTLSDQPGFDQQNSEHLSLKSAWTGKNYGLTAILSLANSDIDYGFDEDWSFLGIHPFGYRSTDHYFRARKTRSAEIRVNSLSEYGWVAGLFFFDSRENLERNYTFLTNNFLSSYDFKTYALFGEAESEFWFGTNISAGVRLERRETTYQNSDAANFSPAETLWGGEVGVKREFGTNFIGYTSIARGFKAGGFNTDGTLDKDLREFDGEYLIEYEAGIKGRFDEKNINIRLAVFHDKRKSQQVKSSILRSRSDGSTEFIDFLGNAAQGTNKGLEASLDWDLHENWNIALDIAMLDAKFDEYINEFGEDLSGRDQAHAPGHMSSLTVRYSRGPWNASFAGDSKDDFYFSDRHSVKSERSTIINASLSYLASHWKITLWGRNLSDKEYRTRGFGSFGNDPRKLYETEPYYQLGEPRVIGVTLDFFTNL